MRPSFLLISGILVVFLLGGVFLFFGCAGIGPVINPGTFSVISVSPADHSAFSGPTALQSKITATFSKDMDASTINNTTFTVASPEGALAGSVTYEAANKKAVFTPAADLSYFTTYIATISADVKDSEGARLEVPFSWSFTATSEIIGATDESFNNGMGYNIFPAITATDLGNSGNAIALDPDGNIYVAGGSFNVSGIIPNPHGPDIKIGKGNMVIWKCRPDGTLDTSFGDNGKVLKNNSAGGDSLDGGSNIIIEPSGNIVVAGTSSYQNSWKQYSVIWRYNANGVPDTSFTDGSHEGYVVNYLCSTAASKTLAVDPAGKIYFYGVMTTDTYEAGGHVYNTAGSIWRYKPDGSLDESFSDGIHHGYIIQNGNYGTCFSIALTPAGKILVMGNSSNEGTAFWRYDSDGSPDNSFSNQGKGILPNQYVTGWAMTVSPTGKIYVTGNVSYNEPGRGMSPHMILLCYNEDGTLDTGFSDGTNNGFTFYSQVSAGAELTIDSAGRILVAGDFDDLNFNANTDVLVWRYLPSGKPDTSFGNNGVLSWSNGVANTGWAIMDYAYSVTTDPLGKILACGSTAIDTSPRAVVWRFR
jgi:uncharacterized delta-60 repeat protein